MLRVIVVGLGPIGIAAAKAIIADPGMELAGLVDIDPVKLGKPIPEIGGGPPVVRSMKEAAPADIAIVTTTSKLDRLAPTLREARSLEDAGKGGGALHSRSGSLTEPEAQALTLRRLEALAMLPADQPWPPFADTLYGPEVVARGRAAHQEAEASYNRLIESTASTAHGRLMGMRKAPTG